ncbi:endonuclease, partial [Xanthomonas perforans]|uniref:endonuclease n=1 Tax=Xanthomonas perforans TaxID=442694 RepID=UPI00062D09AB
MPEGPSLVILREDTQAFVGRKIVRVSGNSKQDIARLDQQKVLALRSWGKHFLIEFAHFSVRIHFLLSNGQRLNFYACSVQFIERPLDEVYDWTADVMNPLWDPAQARRKLRAAPALLAADALLDQTIFAGVGNIIKNEVLHRIRVHPESTVGALPARKLGELVTQARDYSFDFYTWKKAFVLKKHYQVHTKTSCPRDGAPLQYRKHLGKA